MPIRSYLWIEDRGAGYLFWQCFMEQLCPKVIVEGKRNSSELVKSVKALKDSDNQYIIALDNSFDNPQVTMERKLLKQYVEKNKNVFLMDILCFEYILLEFNDLLKWIYAPDDEFIMKRANAIAAREKLVNSIRTGETDYKKIPELIEYDRHLREHNVEQLVARLLFDLTRNTGFEVSKGTIGECWIKSCCEWKARQNDDICGLDDARLPIFDKMKCIYAGTSLKGEFQKARIEVRNDYDI